MPKQYDRQPEDIFGKPRRTTRRYLPPPIRYAIITSWGSLLGIFVFYLLKKMGY